MVAVCEDARATPTRQKPGILWVAMEDATEEIINFCALPAQGPDSFAESEIHSASVLE